MVGLKTNKYMSEEDIMNFAAKSFVEYLKAHPEADGKECFVDGYLAGAGKMAEYIHDAIMFIANNNPKL